MYDNGALPSPEQPRPNRPVWTYVLTAGITMLVTFALTVGIGLAVLSVINPDFLKPAADSQDRLSFSFEPDPDTQTALAKLQSVFDAIDKSYYTELSDAEMIEAMARGLVNEMDSPYTMYLTAEQHRQLEESMSGDYSGIGAFVG